MTAPTTRLSYGDAYDALNRAKDDPKGVRIKYKTFAEANTLRSRLHYARAVDRRDNTQIYTENNPLYGRSVYDTLVVKIKEDGTGGWWVYIEHAKLNPEAIESLSDIEDAEFEEIKQVEVEETKQLEFKRRI